VELRRPEPGGLKKNIENAKRKIADLKKERGDLERKKNSSTNDGEKRDIERKISDIDKEIEKFEDMIDDWQRKLDGEKKEIDSRLSTGKQCRSARENVAEIFRKAKSTLQSERDAEKKPPAQDIVKKITAEEPGHKRAIETVAEGIKKCERMR
jgi:chromosome segregation ATPase